MKWFLVFLLSLFMVGCQEIIREESSVLHEDAVVLAKIYTPSRHEAGVKPALGFDGKIHFVITSNAVPEKYGVLFKCQHGSFTSQGSDTRHHELHDKLKEGQKVDVAYKEIYKTVFDKDKRGKKIMVNRTLIDFDFLDAIPKNTEEK